ncbi:peptidoglycan D,D-transpeptidase FtsI family protein [Aneurinibacillus terranovensis]|uniref:peptidoglycan D,D-transpeptidase FtsI family protein n=1 Tax=Aneurinibacillus terranovensis TaxID=278991 RepID=UPI00040733B4|nr:penicillin-binding transpeptidase domain-containing protein [Aneurinibacillus terranovensis]
MYNHEEKETQRTNRISKRLNVLLFLVFFVFAIIIIRLSYVQIVKGDEYSQKATSKSDRNVIIPALRGNIYDRSGNLIVYSRGSLTAVFQDQDGLTKVQYLALATKLEKVLGIKRDELLKQMDVGWGLKNNQLVWVGRSSSKFMEKDLKHNLSQQEIAYLAEHRTEFPGVNVVTKPIRVYDAKQVAVQAIGFVRKFSVASANPNLSYYKDKGNMYEPDQVVGLDGVEYAYENYLRGENGRRTYQVAADQTIIKQLGEVPPKQGDNLYLTLDERVQLDTRDFIKNFLPQLRSTNWQKAANAKTAYAVAMEVKTGKIVAMVSYPEYDPNIWVKDNLDTNDYNQISYSVNNGTIRSAPYDVRPLTGQAAITEGQKHPSSIVPSGSVIKPSTVMMGLAEKIISPYDGWQDTGAWHYGRGTDTVHNDNNHNYGYLTPQTALQKSSNTYMARIGDLTAQKYGKKSIDIMQSYQQAFGLGVKTGIDLPFEDNGIEDYLKMNKTYGPLAAMVQASFGQQERFTAMQLCQYAATLANNGKRIKPQIVDHITDPKGKVVRPYTPVVLNTLNEPDIYWNTIREGMGMVTESGGTAGYTFTGFPYRVAAKTGTSDQDIYAQNPDTKKWYKYDSVSNGVFMSYAPLDNPKLAVAVIVPEGGYGASSAGVIARHIYESYDKYVGLGTK